MMNPSSKHLALFTYGLAGSGAQWRMLNLARGFAERDYQVDLIVVRASGPLTQALSPAVRLVALGPWWERLPLFRSKKGHWWLMGLSGLSRYLRHEQPVVLLSTSYFSEARLVILGEGKNRKELERIARKLGVEAHVQLPGFVTNPFVYMAHAAVFVLSSTYEGLPGVLIQALACGCPVVSTNCPSGPSEILEGGIYGSLVAVGNATELAQAILATLDAPPDRDKLRARAAQFSAEHAVDRYRAVLKI